MSARSTKRVKPSSKDTMRVEYTREDLGTGVRGKYYDRFKAGTNVVLLAPDVAEVFGTSDAVNEALRGLIGVATRSTRVTKRVSRPRGRGGKASA